MFKASYSNPDTSIESCLVYSARKEQLAEDREVLCHIVSCVEFLVKQGLPFREKGGEDKVDFSDETTNKGKFIARLQLMR